jgi:hypothetical protein
MGNGPSGLTSKRRKSAGKAARTSSPVTVTEDNKPSETSGCIDKKDVSHWAENELRSPLSRMAPPETNAHFNLELPKSKSNLFISNSLPQNKFKNLLAHQKEKAKQNRIMQHANHQNSPA